MDGEEFQELHKAIEDGDSHLVKQLLQHCGAEKYFRYEDTTALFKAFCNERYNIASYLIHIGAKIDDAEVQDLYYLYELEVDLDQVNYLLSEYNRKSEKSCIFRLLSCSQSPQGLDGERLTAVMCMYEELFKSKHIGLLMKVIETKALDIVYDFQSVDVNKIHRYNISESEIFGLTLTFSNEIFVGAQNLISTVSEERAKVYGVVAEELCHLALTIMFENNANPYRKGDFDLKKDFRGIVLDVNSLLEHSCQTEQVIKDVFSNYDSDEWECELIARVPHVIGIYGEEEGMKKFMEYPELSSLLCFYQQHVIPKCEQYIQDSRNMKHHQLMEEIRKKDFMTYKEKTIQPLKEGFTSFNEHVVDEQGISVITTNCTRLCMLQVYHELKRDSLEKKCLIFSRECFDDKRYEILVALKANVWEYFILVLDKKELSLEKLKVEYLCHFDSFKARGMKIIVILGSQSFGDKSESKTLNYEWSDLSAEYQRFRTCPLRYIFKDEQRDTYIKTEDVPKVFQIESEILQLMSGEPFLVEDGADEDSHGFILETYLNREFKVTALKKDIIKNMPSDTTIFIFGLCRWDFEKLSINKTLVQWLKKSDDEFEKDKKIFIIEDEKAITLSECERKNPGKKCICVHFEEDEFILRNAALLDEDLNEYEKEIRITEEQMVELVEKKKILIISDNAGCGKSTVTSSLVKRVKKHISDAWVYRIDLWKFSLQDDYEFKDSYEEENLFDEIFKMIGLENGFVRWHFKQSNKSDYFLFFDGYDEISSKYKSKALELISFLRRRTNYNIVITTRKHDQQNLEETLNTHSYQLVPFDEAEQVNCFQKLLKWRLKYPFGEGDKHSKKNSKAISRKIENIIKVLEREEESNLEHQELIIAIKKIGLGGNLNSVRSEIDKLDLTKLVENILRETKLEKRIIEFMGIPLHLYMMGSILYFDNFNVEIGADLYALYSKFIDEKILIYVEEKEGYSKEGNQRKKMVDRVTKDVFSIHTGLANQLFDQGKVLEIKNEEAELCHAIGIVSIHSRKTLFIHQTFAEFFKAESIRRNIEKKAFYEIISEEKYEVVRRFLFSALEKKGFENISEELSKDLDFHFEIIYRIHDLCLHSLRNPIKHISDFICPIKIVKQFLKQFTLCAYPELIKEFIKELNTSVYGKMVNGVLIGCCLNVEIIKHLINRNFKYASHLICGFVRFAENVEEVIDVLNEFISKESVSRSLFRRSRFKVFSLWKRENRGNQEERVLNRILELLRTKDLYGNGLICCAIWNERKELFPHILEYFKRVLEKEKFIGGIIESEEYKWQMERFVNDNNPNRICELINEIHSKFENETDILFNFDLKFKIMLVAVKNFNCDESFEKLIDLFIKYFGSMNLKELLQNGNSYGEYLVHEIMKYNTIANIIKRLDLIKNVLGEKLKDFLKIKNKYLENILHFTARNENEINFNFLNFYLSEEEIKKLLIGRENEFGRTCLHFAAFYDNVRQLPFFINYTFKILKSEKRILEELLVMKDINGDTFLHLVVHSSYTSIEEIKEFFNYLRSKLSDEIFNKLLRIINENGETFLQTYRRRKMEDLIECCKGILEKELVEDLLRTGFEEGSESVSDSLEDYEGSFKLRLIKLLPKLNK